MREAWIGRPTDGLRLRPVEVENDGSVLRVEAFLRTDGLEARLVVEHHYASGFADLVAFFGALEEDWRGWDGERTFESLEHDLRLSAVHNGHVVINVVLRQAAIPGGWRVQAELVVEAGEELTAVASAVRSLFAT